MRREDIFGAVIANVLQLLPPDHLLANRVTEDTIVMDLGLDSLDVVSLGLALETHFDITLDTPKLIECETIGDFIDIVQSKFDL